MGFVCTSEYTRLGLFKFTQTGVLRRALSPRRNTILGSKRLYVARGGV